MTKSTDNILATELDGRIFNFRPCLFAAFSAAIGIFVAYLTFRYSLSAWWCLLVLPVGGLPYVLLKRKSALLAAALLIFAFLIGVGGMALKLRSYTSAPIFTQTVTVVGKVTKVEFDGGITIDNLSINGEKVDGKLFLVYAGDGIRLSDLVRVRGKILTENSVLDLSDGRASNVVSDIRFRMTGIENAESIGRQFDLFLWIRERMTDTIYNGMSQDSAAVTVALTMGDTSGIDGAFLENVRFGGIGHIFAVSGLHVGSLYAFCLWLSSRNKFIRDRSVLRFILIALTLFCYGGICGFSSSVMRAFLMCMIVHMTKLIGVKTDTLENVGVAACILFLLRPATLFEAGFQLSFTACLSIGAFSKPFARIINGRVQSVVNSLKKENAEEEKEDKNGFRLPPSYWEQARGKFIDLLGVTLGAQVLTVPILFRTFGYISPWGFLLNLLIVPLVSTAFSPILAIVAISSVLPILSGGLLYFIELFIAGIALPFEAFSFGVNRFFEDAEIATGLAYYVIVLIICEKCNLSKRLKKCIVVTFFLIFLFSLIFS